MADQAAPAPALTLDQKKAAARDPQPEQLAPGVAVAPRRSKAGKVQALPAVSPEILAQADEMLGNTDVNRSRALKQALLSEARKASHSLFQDGRQRVIDGLTSLDELLRVTRED